MRIAVFLLLSFAFVAPAFAQGRAQSPETIETVTLHRLHAEYYSCGEHFDGELEYLGDALGTDCVIQSPLSDGRGFVQPFRGDGARNEDWYGWNAEVLAPISGRVVFVHVNEVTNAPGAVGRPPASVIVIERADGMRVLLAHLQDIRVALSDTVAAGQVIARVGNNGFGRNPHIHIGAWMGQTPYQIRWDLRSGGD